MVERILVASDPVDFRMHSSPSDWLTIMPVAQAPRTKALIAKIGSRPNAAEYDRCRSSCVSILSSQPRTQFVGAPVLPEDSSMVTPRGGREPPQQRSSMRYRLTNVSWWVPGTRPHALARMPPG